MVSQGRLYDLLEEHQDKLGVIEAALNSDDISSNRSFSLRGVFAVRSVCECMNRRELLLQLGGVGILAISGCASGQSRDQLAIEGPAPTLSPGADTEIVTTVYNADQVSFSRLPNNQIEATDTDVAPSPDAQYDSFPPGWVWNEPQSSIEATLDISVPSDVNLGEYVYGVSAASGTKAVNAEFTITIDSEQS